MKVIPETCRVDFDRHLMKVIQKLVVRTNNDIYVSSVHVSFS